jgi:hypothetical protein
VALAGKDAVFGSLGRSFVAAPIPQQRRSSEQRWRALVDGQRLPRRFPSLPFVDLPPSKVLWINIEYRLCPVSVVMTPTSSIRFVSASSSFVGG